jgi:hypothetical protein
MSALGPGYAPAPHLLGLNENRFSSNMHKKTPYLLLKQHINAVDIPPLPVIIKLTGYYLPANPALLPSSQ